MKLFRFIHVKSVYLLFAILNSAVVQAEEVDITKMCLGNKGEYSKAAIENRVTCAIIKARELATQKDLVPLKNKELAMHIANRLGFGFSPLLSDLSSKSIDALGDVVDFNMAQYFAQQIASSVLSSGALRPVVEDVIKKEVEMRYENRKPYFAQYVEVLLMGYCLDHPADEKCAGVDLSKLPTVKTQAHKVITEARAALKKVARKSVIDSKLLASVLNSQKIVGGKVVDDQVNFGEVITEFWFNHFNIDVLKTHLFSIGYEEILRTKSFSTFKDLTTAVMKHPAMLVYLDNAVNMPKQKGTQWYASNQNLGREILELHTLGIGPNLPAGAAIYNQNDVESAAKILTGWTLKIPLGRNAVNYDNLFYFNPLNHEKFGVVTLLGHSFPQTGVNQGEAMIKMLANHPQTKKNICSKLVYRILGNSVSRFKTGIALSGPDDREVSLNLTPTVDRCRSAWGEDGQLKQMYLAILSSPDLYSPDLYKATAKNPIEAVISAYRAKGMNLLNYSKDHVAVYVDQIDLDGEPFKYLTVLSEMDGHISNLGIEFKKTPPPTGYPERRGEFTGPSYLVNVIQANHLISGNMSDFEMGEENPMTALKGVAAQSEFATQFVGGPKQSLIPEAIEDEVLACGASAISDEMRENLYGAATIAAGNWDSVKVDANRFDSPLRTIFNNYLSSKEFYLK